MGTEQSLWGYFYAASPVVKLVLLLLLLMSVWSWVLILQRGFFFRRIEVMRTEFEALFWSGIDLHKLYADLQANEHTQTGLAMIFQAGFSEFIQLRKQATATPLPKVWLEGVQRAMHIAHVQATACFEKHLTLLASIGSISPYVGLFGTVWGIMTSFQALALSKQTITIALVAPGISEALVATAMGLFAAIPAVLFYNHYVNTVDRLLTSYELFQEEFINLLHRQVYRQAHAET